LFVRSVTTGDIFAVYGGGATKSWGGLTLGDGDVLIGRSADGYVHWDDSAALLDISGQVNITGDSTVDGTLIVTDGTFAVENDGGTVTYLQVTQNAMFVGGDINNARALSAFFADDQDLPGAGPGGEQFDTGDLIIGEPTAANVFWDQSAGQLLFRDADTVSAYFDEDGISLLYDVAGAHLRTISGSTLVFDLFSQTEGDVTSTLLNFYPRSGTGLGVLAIVGHNISGTETLRTSFLQDGSISFSGQGIITINQDVSVFGRLDLSSSTTDALVLNKLTTTQRNALTSVVDGMILYNTTTAKVQARVGAAWIDLH
jgi:hypothetical protein